MKAESCLFLVMLGKKTAWSKSVLMNTGQIKFHFNCLHIFAAKVNITYHISDIMRIASWRTDGLISYPVPSCMVRFSFKPSQIATLEQNWDPTPRYFASVLLKILIDPSIKIASVWKRLSYLRIHLPCDCFVPYAWLSFPDSRSLAYFQFIIPYFAYYYPTMN